VIVGLLVVVGGLAAVAGASAWRDLRPARAEVLAAQTQLQLVTTPSAFTTPEKRVASRATIAAAQAQLASARQRVRGSPGIWPAQFVPGLRRQRNGLLALIDDARQGSAAVVSLIDRVQSLADRGELRDGAIPLDSLKVIGDEASQAAQVFDDMQRSPSGLLSPLGRARHRLNDVAGPAATSLSNVADALGASHGFLGGTGDRRYLLAIQNNAEMRDQGMVLSYGVLQLGQGRFRFERRGNIGELRLDQAAPTPIPPGTAEVFGSIQPTTLWQSVNATADFEWSGRAMQDMYRQATGETIDGVIAIDVPGLAELLRVVGPVTIPGVAEPITADNANRVLLHDLYEGLSPVDSQSERKEALDDVAGAVIDLLSTGTRDVVGLGTAFSQATRGGHLRMWSAVEAEEQAFVRADMAGGPAAKEADRTFHLAVENRTATKLDYYVQPIVSQEVRFSGVNDVVVRTRVVIENRAPQGAAPSYQLGPDEFTGRPGDYTAWVLLWGPAGALQPASTPESGLTLTQGHVTVGAGERREVVFDTLIHDAVREGQLTLRLVPQPRMQPMDLTVTLDPRGRRVEGPTSWQGPWDRTRSMTWRVRP